MADNIEQLVDIPDKERLVSPEELEKYEKLSKQNIDLTNLLSVLTTAGENATKLIFERVFAKKE